MTGVAERRILWLVGLALVGSACGDGSSEGSPSTSAGEPERWTLSAEPTLEVGVVEGDERYQLHDVADAARLADGRIAAANGSTSEIRVYDGDGSFLVATGGAGDGPGEWRNIAAVRVLAGDTLVVVDPRLARVGLVHATTGAYLGELGDDRAPDVLPRRRHHAGLVLEAPPGFAAWDALEEAARTAEIRSPAAPAEARLDADGRIWVFPAPSARDLSLRVLDLEGRVRAVLPMPDRFEPLATGAEEVIGLWRDALDVEHLRAYAVESAGPWSGPGIGEVPGPSGSAVPEEASSVEAPALTSHFRDIAIAQEMRYATAGSYTSDLAALAEAHTFELPPEIRIDILAAGPTGWWGRLVDVETGAGCSLVYGAFRPVEGLTPGAPACWEGPGGG